MSISITEEFDDTIASYDDYDPFDITLATDLHARKHTDLRRFTAASTDVPQTMTNVEKAMSILDLLSMGELEFAGGIAIDGESWSVSPAVGGVLAVGPDTGLGRLNTLRVTLLAGNTYTVTSTLPPIDLSDWTNTDQLSIAFPSFPGTSIDRSNSFVTIEDSSNIIALNLTNLAATNTNQEALWNLSAIAPITAPTTIHFTFKATANCTVKVGALRVVSPSWTPMKIDIDTLNDKLLPIFTRTGTIPTIDFPQMFRSDAFGDPKPINSKLAVQFNTGAFSANNRIRLFLRERREDFLTQLDLDGSPLSNLDGQRQPDFGQAVYSPHPQSDLEGDTQTILEPLTQAELDRIADTISASWIQIELQFGSTNSLTIGTTETPAAYSFSVSGLTSASKYILVTELVDNALQVFIYAVDSGDLIDIDSPIFDSTLIDNDFLFKRRRGRIGWDFDLLDGDSSIQSIRTRGLMFGELITSNLESITPVEGARVFAGNTPDIRLPARGASYGGSVITIDTNNSRSTDGSDKVVANASQGLQTEFANFSDFANTKIVFDLYYPSSALAQDDFLEAALMNTKGSLIPITLPRIKGDQWQTITLRPFALERQQTGLYRFVLSQVTGTQTWWVDNLYIAQKSVAWSGRATSHDAWGRGDNIWTNFYDLVNTDSGVMFSQRGKWLQARGQALTQDATIDKVYIKPKYSELGRMVWNDDAFLEIPSDSLPVITPAPNLTSATAVQGDGPITIGFTGTFQAYHTYQFTFEGEEVASYVPPGSRIRLSNNGGPTVTIGTGTDVATTTGPSRTPGNWYPFTVVWMPTQRYDGFTDSVELVANAPLNIPTGSVGIRNLAVQEV